MKNLINLTGIYNTPESITKNIEEYQEITNISIIEDNFNYSLHISSTRLDLEPTNTNNIIKKVEKGYDMLTNVNSSQFFDDYCSSLINLSKSNEDQAKMQIYAEVLFNYIILDVIGDSMHYSTISYQIAEIA